LEMKVGQVEMDQSLPVEGLEQRATLVTNGARWCRDKVCDWRKGGCVDWVSPQYRGAMTTVQKIKVGPAILYERALLLITHSKEIEDEMVGAGASTSTSSLAEFL